jgi:hypothetical protein
MKKYSDYGVLFLAFRFPLIKTKDNERIKYLEVKKIERRIKII